MFQSRVTTITISLRLSVQSPIKSALSFEKILRVAPFLEKSLLLQQINMHLAVPGCTYKKLLRSGMNLARYQQEFFLNTSQAFNEKSQISQFGSWKYLIFHNNLLKCLRISSLSSRKHASPLLPWHVFKQSSSVLIVCTFYPVPVHSECTTVNQFSAEFHTVWIGS